MVKTYGWTTPKPKKKKTEIVKKFDGKPFLLEKSYTEKKKANKYAKQRRKIRNSRVVKAGKNIWDVYVIKR